MLPSVHNPTVCSELCLLNRFLRTFNLTILPILTLRCSFQFVCWELSLCLYHVSRIAGWNRRVVWQEQGSRNVRQNRDSTEVQLWALNVNYWTLPNTGQAHHLEHNRRGKRREQKLITLPICRHTQYKICLNTDINAQIHTHAHPLTRGGWMLPNTAMRRVWCSRPTALATSTRGNFSEVWGRITTPGEELWKSSDGVSSYSWECDTNKNHTVNEDAELQHLRYKQIKSNFPCVGFCD